MLGGYDHLHEPDIKHSRMLLEEVGGQEGGSIAGCYLRRWGDRGEVGGGAQQGVT